MRLLIVEDSELIRKVTRLAFRGPHQLHDQEQAVTPADYDLLSKIEQGTSTFRPSGPEVGFDPEFARTMEGLLRLRTEGWINLPDTRIAWDRGRPHSAHRPLRPDAGRAPGARTGPSSAVSPGRRVRSHL